MSVLQPMTSKVKWKTRMDERSCNVCRARNNRIYNKSQAPDLPAHDNCRCRLVNYTPHPRKPKHAQLFEAPNVGPSYWNVMFSKAYNLPEHVSNNKRLQFRQEIQSLVKSYPCSDCVIDAMAWMKANKMEGDTRNDYINYLCNFKNFVNSKTGKDIYDCSVLLTSEPMTHNIPPAHQHTSCQCNAHPGKKYETAEHDPESSGTLSEQGSLVRPDFVGAETEYKKQNRNENSIQLEPNHRASQSTYELYNAFKDYKSLSKKIVENLCKTYNIPTPQIIFDKCPDGSNKSCVVSKTIYLDPNQYSARTLLHEFIHYHANYHGNKQLDLDEAKIDTIAQALIDRSFNSVNSGSKLGRIRHDTFITPEIQKRSASILDGWKSSFPLLQKAMNYDPTTAVVMGPNGQPATAVYPQSGGGTGIVAPQPVIIQDPKDDPSTGLMAMFDNVYTPFANLLGLKARDVNESHTPSIIQNAVTTLAEGNLSDLGALSVSLISSIVLFGLGVLGKDHIVVGDRKLLAEMGAGFMWQSMQYVGNPKSMDTIMEDSKNLGEALGRWNTDQSLKIITNDKRDMRKTQQMKRIIENRRRMMGGMEMGDFGGDVIFSKSGPNGPSESAFSDEEKMALGMAGGPLLFTADGGRPTRVLVGADGKTLMKTMPKKEDRGADIRGLIGTTQSQNPFNRQSPFTFVGGSALGQGEPDRRPTKAKRMHTGEYMMDDLDGEFIPQEMEHYYRPAQEFPNMAIT